MEKALENTKNEILKRMNLSAEEYSKIKRDIMAIDGVSAVGVEFINKFYMLAKKDYEDSGERSVGRNIEAHILVKIENNSEEIMERIAKRLSGVPHKIEVSDQTLPEKRK